MLKLAATLPFIVTEPFLPICSAPVPDKLPVKVRLPPAMDRTPLSTMAPLIVASVATVMDLPASMVMVPAAATPEPILRELLASTKIAGAAVASVPAWKLAGAWMTRLPACTEPPFATLRLAVAKLVVAASPKVRVCCTVSREPAPPTWMEPAISVRAAAIAKTPPSVTETEPVALNE